MGERSASDGVTIVDLGPLRNGLGSLKNLELLLKSIKVGQKGLFAAVSAVHADCAPMIASALSIADALVASGIDGACARRLEGTFTSSLRQLESELTRTVASGRLSVSERLKLEGVIARSVHELGATLPLASLLERTSQRAPLEPTPVDLIIEAGPEVAESEGVLVHVTATEAATAAGLAVQLEAAKLLVAVGVGLCAHGSTEQPVRVSFETSADGRALTRITRDRTSGAPIKIAAPRVVEPTLLCADAASRRMGGSMEYSAPNHRVCIWWPA